MLEKPDLPDSKIVTCLQDAYGLSVSQVAFLPLGVDVNAAVYRAITDAGISYFVKLRRGDFDETTVTLPKFLRDHGIEQIIAPLATRTGQLWASLSPFQLILYPFIEGHNGYETDMTDRHWIAFGTALRRVHTAVVPSELTRRIHRETYSAQWREMVKAYLRRVENEVFEEAVAVKLATFLKARGDEIMYLVERAEQLAQALQARPPEFVVCHSDVHAGNVLISANDALYIVDWDNPILALKERDLMFAGGAQGFTGYTAEEEEALFYQGYGQTQIDPVALAYYRYERIVEDIAAFCEQIFLTEEGGEDREQALHYVASNFLPGGTIEMAHRADPIR